MWITPRLQLVRGPKQFDAAAHRQPVGDILSDEAAMLTGSIGMLPQRQLAPAGRDVFEAGR